jgi:hypothetical protein
MKSKLIVVVAAIMGAGVIGYWTGVYRTKQVWTRIVDGQIHRAHQYHNCVRVSVNTQVLQHLADGKQAEARAALERQLDVALVQVVAYEKLYNPQGRDAIEFQAVRSARDYRSQHPWTSQPDNAEAVQLAFKWAD